jgi:hypothetical protein
MALGALLLHMDFDFGHEHLQTTTTRTVLLLRDTRHGVVDLILAQDPLAAGALVARGWWYITLDGTLGQVFIHLFGPQRTVATVLARHGPFRALVISMKLISIETQLVQRERRVAAVLAPLCIGTVSYTCLRVHINRINDLPLHVRRLAEGVVDGRYSRSRFTFRYYLIIITHK